MQFRQAKITLPQSNAVNAAFTALAQDFDIPAIQDANGRRLGLAGGEIHLEPSRLTVTGADERAVFRLQQVVISRFSKLDPSLTLRWDQVDVGALPPTVTRGEVLEITQISPRFRRVRLGIDDISRFGADALHFRLVISAFSPDLAKGGSIQDWSTIGADGAVIWPKGDGALHRPVYTLTSVNHAQGWIDFDIFLHEGGRVTCWSERAEAGDKIALLGPTTMRNDLPAWLAFYGDETALPAIRLYLAALAGDTCGEVVISLNDMGDAQDLPRPEGVKLRYIHAAPDALIHALRAQNIPSKPRFIYVGCERSQATAARDYLQKDCGLGKNEMQVTAFWSA